MKEIFAKHDEWEKLLPFATGVRASVAMVRMNCKEEVFDMIRQWKALDENDIKFKGVMIRARTDKPPAQRKANGKIWAMASYLRNTFNDKEVDADFRNSSVWMGDWEVVKWDTELEGFRWLDDGISHTGLDIQRAEAEEQCKTP